MEQPKTARDLLRVDSKAPEVCKGFSEKHMTAYSVLMLESWSIPTLYENIAVLNGRLFPHKFTLPGFAEFPDSEKTNRSILQMRPKYGNFAVSDRRKGVFLTEKGRREAHRVLDAVGPPTCNGNASAVRITKSDWLAEDERAGRTYSGGRDIAEHRQNLLFMRYSENRLDEAEVVHLLGFLGLYDHTPPIELRREVKRLREVALDLGDKEFVHFIDEIKLRFQAYLDRAGSTKGKG